LVRNYRITVSGKEAKMMYGGIDLHSNNSVVSVIDDADRVVAQKRLPNDITKIVGFLARWQRELAGVVVESTYNWYWLVDGLQDAGLQVHLANTAAIKQYEGLKHSGDEADAQHLAHLLRLGILPTGTILPREHRAVRDPARKRMQLVQCRTSQVLAIENIMARQLDGRMTSNQIKRLRAAMPPGRRPRSGCCLILMGVWRDPSCGRSHKPKKERIGSSRCQKLVRTLDDGPANGCHRNSGVSRGRAIGKCSMKKSTISGPSETNQGHDDRDGEIGHDPEQASYNNLWPAPRNLHVDPDEKLKHRR
jgi:hypothetical protein